MNAITKQLHRCYRHPSERDIGVCYMRQIENHEWVFVETVEWGGNGPMIKYRCTECGAVRAYHLEHMEI